MVIIYVMGDLILPKGMYPEIFVLISVTIRFRFHDRFGLILPSENSLIQRRLHQMHQYMEVNQMIINTRKSVVMPFNFSRNYDFLPSLTYDSRPLDVVYKTCLLGLILTSDCKFSENTKHITSKA